MAISKYYKIKKEGKRAYQDGQDLMDNPYIRLGIAHSYRAKNWEEGWQEARLSELKPKQEYSEEGWDEEQASPHIDLLRSICIDLLNQVKVNQKQKLYNIIRILKS